MVVVAVRDKPELGTLRDYMVEVQPPYCQWAPGNTSGILVEQLSN